MFWSAGRPRPAGRNCVTRARRSSARAGYALPLVLLAIALILLYTLSTTGRLRREAQINRLRENSEIAYYAAESGFNRTRARIITKAKDGPGGDKVLALNGLIETLPGGGTYQLVVTAATPTGSNLAAYRIEATGTYGSGSYQTTRYVKGTVEITNQTTDRNYYRVATQYDR